MTHSYLAALISSIFLALLDHVLFLSTQPSFFSFFVDRSSVSNSSRSYSSLFVVHPSITSSCAPVLGTTHCKNSYHSPSLWSTASLNTPTSDSFRFYSSLILLSMSLLSSSARVSFAAISSSFSFWVYSSLTVCWSEICSLSSRSAECCIALSLDLVRATSCLCSSNACLYLLLRSSSSCFLRIAILFCSSACLRTSPSQSFSSPAPWCELCSSKSWYPSRPYKSPTLIHNEYILIVSSKPLSFTSNIAEPVSVTCASPHSSGIRLNLPDIEGLLQIATRVWSQSPCECSCVM